MMMNLIYLICAMLFVWAISGLSAPATARRGNLLAVLGMGLAIVMVAGETLIYNKEIVWAVLVLGLLVGLIVGRKIALTALPQMVALLNGLGGLASALIILSEKQNQQTFIGVICLVIGLVTFSGSMVAFGKLQGIIRSHWAYFKWLSVGLVVALLSLPAVNWGSAELGILIVLSLLLGISLTMPIGGADMPVVIAMLNSFSGWAVVLVGLVTGDLLLLIAGALIGASGTILSYIMSKAMNRSIYRVLWPKKTVGITSQDENRAVKIGSPEEASFLLKSAHKVIIVPGFGMASAQAQGALKNLATILSDKYQVEVKFAIHPVAGRMPGHMNVLLAEAGIPYENVYAMSDINGEFANTDVAYVVGANDITNPAAKNDENSPLYGMPVLDVEKAHTVFFVKRSMATGYSGVENALFYAPNTIMLFGDAKKVTEDIVKDLDQ